VTPPRSRPDQGCSSQELSPHSQVTRQRAEQVELCLSQAAVTVAAENPATSTDQAEPPGRLRKGRWNPVPTSPPASPIGPTLLPYSFGLLLPKHNSHRRRRPFMASHRLAWPRPVPTARSPSIASKKGALRAPHLHSMQRQVHLGVNNNKPWSVPFYTDTHPYLVSLFETRGHCALSRSSPEDGNRRSSRPCCRQTPGLI